MKANVALCPWLAQTGSCVSVTRLLHDSMWLWHIDFATCCTAHTWTEHRILQVLVDYCYLYHHISLSPITSIILPPYCPSVCLSRDFVDFPSKKWLWPQLRNKSSQRRVTLSTHLYLTGKIQQNFRDIYLISRNAVALHEEKKFTKGVRFWSISKWNWTRVAVQVWPGTLCATFGRHVPDFPVTTVRGEGKECHTVVARWPAEQWKRPDNNCRGKEMGGMKPSSLLCTGWTMCEPGQLRMGPALAHFSCAIRGEERMEKGTRRVFMSALRRGPALRTGARMLSSKPKWVTPGRAPIPLPICEDFCKPMIRLSPVPCVHQVPPHPLSSNLCFALAPNEISPLAIVVMTLHLSHTLIMIIPALLGESKE